MVRGSRSSAFHKRRDQLGLFSIKRSRNTPSDCFRRAPQRVIIKMRVARGGRCLSVAQQSADNRQSQSSSGTEARKGMPQIVNANAG